MSVEKNPRSKTRPWLARYRDSNGQQRSKSFERKKDAEAFERTIKDAKYVGEELTPDKANMPVGKFYREVFLKKKRAAQSTRDTWQRQWSPKGKRRKPGPQHLCRFENTRLSAFNNRELFIDWIAEMDDDPTVSDAQKHLSVSLATGILVLAIKLKYLRVTLAVSGLTTEIGYEPKDTGVPWLPEQIESIREHLLDTASKPPQGHYTATQEMRDLYRWRRERDATIVSVNAYQPFREGEVFALQWPMLLDDSGKGIRQWVEVSHRIPKNDVDPEDRTKTSHRNLRTRAYSKPRELALTEHTRRDLRWWWVRCGQPSEGYVFPPSPGEDRFDYTGMKNWSRNNWHKPVAAVGLEARPPKHLRMSAVSMMILDGSFRDSEIAHQAGHTVGTMEVTYNRAYRLRRERDKPFVMEAEISAARENRDFGVRRIAAVG